MVKSSLLLKLLSTLLSVFATTALCANVSSQDWQEVEKKAHNAVVQILAQKTKFNWTDPYKSPEQSEGAGSGFFINDQGDLITNFHVVEGAKSVHICVPDLGRKLIEAKIVRVCPEADIAELTITQDGKNILSKHFDKIPFLQLGDSDILYPTEPVLALGYPMGQRYLKSTVGVVAGREYIGGQSFMHITAPLNPGNSGGPLLNTSGKVVGVNSAIISDAQNIGYIVPINDVKIILDDLRKTRLLRKPKLGIFYNATTEEHARMLKCPTPSGIYINNILKGSVAEKAGMRIGDVLYEINGYSIDQYGDVAVGWRSSGKVSLEEFLIRCASNTPLKFVLYRKGKKLSLSCNFCTETVRPVRTIYSDFEPEACDYEMVGGLCIMQLRSNHLEVLPRTVTLQTFLLPENQDTNALVVTRVLPGSYLHKVGCFYEGTLFYKVNGKKVTTLQELRQALLLSAKSGVISFENKDKYATVASLETILKDENRLARDFMFTKTEAVQQLEKLVSEKKSRKKTKKK